MAARRIIHCILIAEVPNKQGEIFMQDSLMLYNFPPQFLHRSLPRGFLVPQYGRATKQGDTLPVMSLRQLRNKIHPFT